MRRSENPPRTGARLGGAAGFAAAAVAALLAAAPAAFADQAPATIEVGHSAYVLNTVNGQAPRARPVLIRLNDKIVFEEEVAAGREAKTTIEFRDGSLFSLGPDARARIDSFIFDPQRSTSHKALAVTRGVFRYLSGFTARDQEAKIKVPSGTLGIRGSLVVGVVTPGAPDFLFVAQGNAIFTNDAGSVELHAGEGIAIGSRSIRPISPNRMPLAILAKVLRTILQKLPSGKLVVAQSKGNSTLLLSEGKANLLPAATQERLEHLNRGHGDHGGSAGGSTLTRELEILVEADKLGLFDGKKGRRTAAELEFLAKLEHGKRGDEAYLHDLVKAAAALHHDNAARALRIVGQGIVLVTLADAEHNPADAARLLQKAINALRVDKAVAGHLVSLFAAAVAETESCDPQEAKELLRGLKRVLRRPRNADLLAYAPNVLNNVVDVSPGPAPTSPPNPPSDPTPSGGTFGSFGSSAGSGISTSPAS